MDEVIFLLSYRTRLPSVVQLNKQTIFSHKTSQPNKLFSKFQYSERMLRQHCLCKLHLQNLVGLCIKKVATYVNIRRSHFQSNFVLCDTLHQCSDKNSVFQLIKNEGIQGLSDCFFDHGSRPY